MVSRSFKPLYKRFLLPCYPIRLPLSGRGVPNSACLQLTLEWRLEEFLSRLSIYDSLWSLLPLSRRTRVAVAARYSRLRLAVPPE
jgi:hypothetical protein